MGFDRDRKRGDSQSFSQVLFALRFNATTTENLYTDLNTPDDRQAVKIAERIVGQRVCVCNMHLRMLCFVCAERISVRGAHSMCI